MTEAGPVCTREDLLGQPVCASLVAFQDSGGLLAEGLSAAVGRAYQASYPDPEDDLPSVDRQVGDAP